MSDQKNKGYLATVFRLQDKKLEFKICKTIEEAQEWLLISVCTEHDELQQVYHAPFELEIDDTYHVQLDEID